MDNNNTPQGAMPQMRPAAQPAAQPVTGQPLVGRPVVRPAAQTQFAGGLGAQPASVARPVGAAPVNPAAMSTAQAMGGQTSTAQPSIAQAGATARPTTQSVNGTTSGIGGASMNGTAPTGGMPPMGGAAQSVAAGAAMTVASGYRSAYAQPVPQPTEDKPTDEDKKKKNLLIGGIIGGVALLTIVVVVVVMIGLNRVDYSESYAIATQLKTTVDNIYSAGDCEDVAEYADIASVPNATYSEYIAGCSATFENNASSLISQLGQTAGVQKNEEIATQYVTFSNAYNNMVNEITGTLTNKLDLYQAWHQFIVAVDSLTYADSSDEEFAAAAAYLTATGNQSFVNYGEGWYNLSIEVANAYRAFASATSWNQDSLHQAYDDKLNELLTWIEANRPNFSVVAELDFTSASTMYTEFNKLYTLITDNNR